MPDSTLSAPIVTLAGRPVLDCLPAASTISGKIMSRFVVNSALAARVPLAVLRRDVTAMVGACLELTARLLADDDTAKPLADVRAGAIEWAYEGVPIDTMHKAVNDGLRVMFDHLIAQASSDRDHDAMVELARVFVELSSRLATVISEAYLDEMRAAGGDDTDAVTAALMAGNATPAMARASGIRLAESYVVFAVEFVLHHEQADPHPDRQIVAPRVVRSVRAEVLRHCGDHALMQMGNNIATLLIPRDHFDPADAERFVERIAAAAQRQARATCVAVGVDSVSEAVERVHAVLDIMRRLRRVGLERFEDLSLEYQLSRPGAAGKHLAAILDPLEPHPVLLETLTAHLATRSTRLRTARALHVHPNTVDYRLNKIAEITGLDPMQSDGVWRLRSALVARMIGVGEQGQDSRADPDRSAPTAQAC
ncbi:PucR family transcriptional regulator [Nocardia sp. NPDC058633]|uniref:PucR family transcriptional regulator n=1 Tax=Nocardia sp. NPDC058633 TaxID=3346568 RepID=UPI00365723C8